jgi:hypothetical protein
MIRFLSRYHQDQFLISLSKEEKRKLGVSVRAWLGDFSFFAGLDEDGLAVVSACGERSSTC